VKWQLINLILKSRMLKPRKSLCLFNNSRLLRVNLVQESKFLILNLLNSKIRNNKNHNNRILSLANQRKIIRSWTWVRCSRALLKSQILSQLIPRNLSFSQINLLIQTICNSCLKVKNRIK
jgi:hypothetical protein